MRFVSMKEAIENFKELGFDLIKEGEDRALMAKKVPESESIRIVTIEAKPDWALASMQSLTKGDFEAIKEFTGW